MKFENTKWAERLNYLSELEDGWYDNIDGKAISEKALNTADKILRYLDTNEFVVPSIFPSIEEGYGISMEWVDYKELRARGDYSHVSCNLSNDCDTFDIYILERRDANKELSIDNLEDTSLETASYEEAMNFLHQNLKRLGFCK